MAHQIGKGWPLLEDPLECDNILYVAEGNVLIDKALVVSVRYDDRLEHPFGYYHIPSHKALYEKYSAMNNDTDKKWIDKPPTSGNNWTVNRRTVNNTYNPSCLYVHKSYITPAAPAAASAAPAAASAAAPGGGSRRSRRHKRSNRARKQKKRTRKH